MTHTPSILDYLASYFHTSETWIVLGMIAIGLGILAAVGRVITEMPYEEGTKDLGAHVRRGGRDRSTIAK